MRKDFRDSRQPSGDTVRMGRYLHPAQDLLVAKLEHRDIPYPNSPVLRNGRQIGRVDEIFGPIDNTFLSVRLNDGVGVDSFSADDRLDGYREKFMARERFLPREETERRKEREDRKKERGPPSRTGNDRGRTGNDRGDFRKQQRGNDRGGSDRGRTGNDRSDFRKQPRGTFSGKGEQRGPVRKDFRKGRE